MKPHIKYLGDNDWLCCGHKPIIKVLGVTYGTKRVCAHGKTPLHAYRRWTLA